MIFKSFLIFCAATPVLGDTLSAGSVFFDSVQTYNQTLVLSGHHDNEAIEKLINERHIGVSSEADEEIQVLGTDPVFRLVKFRFLDDPTVYWTAERWIDKEEPKSTPSPTPEPSATPTPHPVNPEPRHRVKPPADDDDQKIWHQVNGEWKWYYKNRKAPERQITVRRALPVEAPVSQRTQ